MKHSPLNFADTEYARLLKNNYKNNRNTAAIHRQKLNQYLQENKLEAIRAYDNYLQALQNIHQDCREKISWQSILAQPQPKLPHRESLQQLEAEYNYQTYEPSLLDYLFLQHRAKARELLDQVQLAAQADDLKYNLLLKNFKLDVAEWKVIQAVAKGIQSASIASYQRAIEVLNPFSAITLAGSAISYQIFETHVKVEIDINLKELLPDYQLQETAAGQLSIEQVEPASYQRLFYSYACGSALRAAREVFALLPLKFALINVYQLNSSAQKAGLGRSAIISILFDERLSGMQNFKENNYSQLINQFPHQLDFTIAEGFASITPLEIEKTDNN